MTSLAPLQPKKGKRRKEKADIPPEVPAKGKQWCAFPPESTGAGLAMSWACDVVSGQGEETMEDMTSVIIRSREPH